MNAQRTEKRIINKRFSEIAELAEFISEDYFDGLYVQPEIIADYNDVTYSYGNYKQCFDGLLECSQGKFHIYLNLDRLQNQLNPRARFTFAHELGHYFIDEHRNSLLKGGIPYHGSLIKLNNKILVEREADVFATNLLMPTSKFRQVCYRRIFSENLIDDLTTTFGTSITSTIIRIRDLDIHPIAIVMARNGTIEWISRSADFKYKYLPRKGDRLPNNTIAWEYHYKGARSLRQDIVYSDDWFNDFEISSNESIMEKCYYLPGNFTLSLLWYK